MIVLSFALTGCDSIRDFLNHQSKAASQGSPYEVVTVCREAQWRGVVGDTLRSIMLQPVEMLNQREPLFDVLRVTPDGFLKLNKLHMNVLVINVGEKYQSPEITVSRDVYATNQLVVTASASSDTAMLRLLDVNRSNIVAAFESVERQRHQATFKTFGPKQLSADVASQFGFTMSFPVGFKLANKSDNFMWTRYEMPQSSQGIIIYQYPYTSPDQLREASIIAMRNTFVAKVPGPADGSYMSTADAVSDAMRIDGRLWIRTRGFWDVKGDFMGGPFVSYTTVDTVTSMVVTIDCYVYSPSIRKRNYLRELEHVVYGVTFPVQ